MNGQVRDIPAVAEMIGMGPRFVCWRNDEIDGKLRKVPYKPSGNQAKSNDPKTWRSYEECADALEGFDGLGVMLGDVGDGRHLVGLDLDNALEGGKIRSWAQEVIDDLRTYTEVSPSGTGVKLFGLVDRVPELASKKLVIRKAPEEHHNEQIEVFAAARYFTITGSHLDGTPDTLEDVTEAFERLAHRLAREKKGKANGASHHGPEVEVDPEWPAVILQLLETDQQFRRGFLAGEKLTGGEDHSASGLDWSLALWLGRQDLPMADAETILAHFPHGQKKDERQLAKLLEKAKAEREKATPPEFGEPIDILGTAELTGCPVLTPDCVPAAIYDYATTEGQRMCSDPLAIALHCLSAVSVAASDRWRIKPKQYDPWTQQPRLWGCVIKPPGGRGTDMLRAAFWPLTERETRLRKKFQAAITEWQEQLDAIESKKDQNAWLKKNPKPRQERILTNDATVEALSELLKEGDEHAKLGYYADELAVFLDFGRYKSGKGGGGSRATMLQAYDGGPQQIDRVLRGAVFVANWSVSVAGNIQPRKLEGMGEDLISDGLFQRFVVIHAAPQALYDDDDQPIDPTAGATYRSLIDEVFKLRPAVGAEGEDRPCFLDNDGRAERRQLHRLIQRLQHDETMPVLVREAASKWSGLFARLCLIFHIVELATQAARGEDPTQAELAQVAHMTAARAAAFIRRAVMPNLFRLAFETLPDREEHASARWIAQHILAHRLNAITASRIGRAFRKLRGRADEIADCMAILNHAGWTRQAESRSDGARWEVNPVVHERFEAAAEAERERRAEVRELIAQKVGAL